MIFQSVALWHESFELKNKAIPEVRLLPPSPQSLFLLLIFLPQMQWKAFSAAPWSDCGSSLQEYLGLWPFLYNLTDGKKPKSMLHPDPKLSEAVVYSSPSPFPLLQEAGYVSRHSHWLWYWILACHSCAYHKFVCLMHIINLCALLPFFLFYLFCFFGGSMDWTQGFCTVHMASPFCWDRVLLNQ